MSVPSPKVFVPPQAELSARDQKLAHGLARLLGPLALLVLFAALGAAVYLGAADERLAQQERAQGQRRLPEAPAPRMKVGDDGRGLQREDAVTPRELVEEAPTPLEPEGVQP